MAIPKSEFIWFNGEFVPWDEAKVHVLSHVLHYGSSVFEGIRVYQTPKGPAILGLEPHVKRLFQSCKIINMPISYSQEEIRQAIIDTVARNKHQACYIRPLVFRGYEVLGVDPRNCPVEFIIATWQWGAYLGADAIEKGVDVAVSSWRRMAPDTHPAMAKAGGNYINSQMVVMEAKRHGYVEGIVLDVQGYVSEGSGENIFVVLEDKIYTPPLGNSILAGITRKYAITLAEEKGYKVIEQLIPREMLYIADEIFFTGTAAEITPVKSVDGVSIGSGSRGPITEGIQSDFFSLITGESEDRYGWLTLVG
ncbi:branched-chain amino acid transaminase [Anaerolineales bacterium HSG6]|nr:branched-chain amino acid transaminase [Anaerolineales bacterium HSG6]MDM8531444.1 branched-chain amino acid transaminase [Anaerolineales bacterium HSG25]